MILPVTRAKSAPFIGRENGHHLLIFLWGDRLAPAGKHVDTQLQSQVSFEEEENNQPVFICCFPTRTAPELVL